MKVYKFKNKKDQKTYALPFNSKFYFREYLKKYDMESQNYRVVRRKYRLQAKKLLSFTNELLEMKKSNIDIILALEIIIAQEDQFFGAILWNIQQDIASGKSISLAFQNFEDVFPKIYLNLIAIGEETNNLEYILAELAKNIEVRINLGRKIKEATFYPSIISFFLVCLLAFIFTVVIPNFENFFEELGGELPFLTQVLIWISSNFIYVLIGVIGLISLLVFAFRNLEENTKEKIKLKIPVISFFVKNKVVAEFCENFQLLLKSKIGVVESLIIMAENSEDIFLKKQLLKVKNKLLAGEEIYSSFRAVRFFTYEEVKLIYIGEKTQTVAKYFQIIAKNANRRIEQRLFIYTTLLQPLLFLVIGSIVGVIILGIYLPIFQMTTQLM